MVQIPPDLEQFAISPYDDIVYGSDSIEYELFDKEHEAALYNHTLLCGASIEVPDVRPSTIINGADHYGCTRPEKHEGPHVALSHDEIVAVWEDV